MSREPSTQPDQEGTFAARTPRTTYRPGPYSGPLVQRQPSDSLGFASPYSLSYHGTLEDIDLNSSQEMVGMAGGVNAGVLRGSMVLAEHVSGICQAIGLDAMLENQVQSFAQVPFPNFFSGWCGHTAGSLNAKYNSCWD